MNLPLGQGQGSQAWSSWGRQNAGKYWYWLTVLAHPPLAQHGSELETDALGGNIDGQGWDGELPVGAQSINRLGTPLRGINSWLVL